MKDVQSHFGDINDTIDIADEGAGQIKTLITEMQSKNLLLKINNNKEGEK